MSDTKSARGAFLYLADTIFPDALMAYRYHEQMKYRLGSEYVSSLPLQMALYFNAFFAPFCLLVNIAILDIKFDKLDIIHKILTVTVLVVMTFVEVIRLYLGYVGNLTEQIPELAGSFLLTFLLQLPLCLFLLLQEGALIQPIERFINGVLLVFIAFETVTSFLAAKRLINHIRFFHQRQLLLHNPVPIENLDLTNTNGSLASPNADHQHEQ